MADPEITQISGLQVSNNTFSGSPPGSLSVADNIIIKQKGVAQPRNGQALYSTLPSAADLPFALTEFQQHLLVNYGTSKTDTSMGLGYVNSGTVSAYSGTYNPVDDDGVATDYARMHFAQAAQFLHFCTQSAPKVLEAYNGTPRTSGLSRMPDIQAVGFIPTGTQIGWLPYNSSAAYRVTLRRTTSTGVPIESPPSNRFVLTNRFLAPVGGLVRTGGNTVTVTISPFQPTSIFQLPFLVGSTFTLSPGEANFAAGTYTVTGASGNTFTYTNAGSNVASTVAQELEPGAPTALVSSIVAQLPTSAVAGDAVRLYRSVVTSQSTIDPSDDLYLAAETYLSGLDISSGFVQILDYTPQSVLQDPLYTNPSDGDGQGLPGGNFQPPIYRDVANWDSQTWYVNTTGQHSMKLQMLGVGGPNGIQDGDTITVSDGSFTQAFTFKNSPGSFTDVQITSSGLPDFNIAWTTYALVVAINEAILANGVAGYGSTAVNGFPGALTIERTDWGAKFNVKASRPASWTPALSASTPTYSDNNRQPNGLYNSKLQQPEAVPAVNFRNIGSSSYFADRILGLRNALLVFKEGDGIWSLTGTAGHYSLQQISTANIIAPDCAAVFADSAWVYTDQGILRVSDTGGAQVVSRPIETVLNALAAEFPDETFAWSFAVPYETERRIMFYVVTAAGTVPTLEAFCYSAATNAWTKFNPHAISGQVSTSHRLWLGGVDEPTGDGILTQERKSDTYLDIADLERTNSITATSVNGNPLLIELSSSTGVDVGTGIQQGSYRTKVAAVRADIGPLVYEVAEVIPWSVASCSTFDAYEVEIHFLPEGQPGARKVLTRLHTLYKPEEFANYFGKTTLFTDQIQAELEVATPSVGFGLNPFGPLPFGDPSPMVVDTNPVAADWVNAGQFFPGFKLNEVWCAFFMQGVGMKIDGAEAPVGRGK